VFEDRIELGLKGADLLGGEIETCQFGDVADIDVLVGHGKVAGLWCPVPLCRCRTEGSFGENEEM